MSIAPGSPGPEEENYEIGRQLARGGMGSVMLAEDRNLGRRVALKVMSLDAWSDPALRRRFVREARVLAHLAHPNIVPIYDLVWEDGIPQFYTMKLVEGRTLQEILDGLRQREREDLENFSLDGLLTVFLKVCDAIAFAHSQGVIHRDLKPDNIMVGEFGEVLVMDWGLAGLIDDLGAGRITSLNDGLAIEAGPGPIELTLQGEVMGSPRYMSPEQAAGRVEEIGPRSDIFSLGGILYTILTLHPPVDGASAAEVLKKLLGGDITPPSGFASSSRERMIARPGALASRRSRKFSHCPGGKIPPGLSAVAMHALALDPAERYPDAEVLAADINAHRGGFSTSVQKVNAPGQLLLLMKRHKVMSGSALLLLIVSVCFIVGLARSAEAERRSAEVARRTAYSASLAQALAAREHHDFGKARHLLAEIEPGRRGFDWRLVNGLCQGDDLRSFRLGDGAGSVPQCFYLFPDGLRIAIISADGRLHLLDLDGREVTKPRRLPALHLASQSLELQSYYGLKISPDGLRLAYANGDVLQVIDAVSFEVLHQEISRRPQFDWLDDQRLLYGFNGSVARPPYPEAGAWILDFGGERGADGRFPRTAFPEMCAPLAVSADRRVFVLHWVDTNPTSWERRLNVFPADANPGDEPILKHLMPGLDYLIFLHILEVRAQQWPQFFMITVPKASPNSEVWLLSAEGVRRL